MTEQQQGSCSLNTLTCLCGDDIRFISTSGRLIEKNGDGGGRGAVVSLFIILISVQRLISVGRPQCTFRRIESLWRRVWVPASWVDRRLIKKPGGFAVVFTLGFLRHSSFQPWAFPPTSFQWRSGKATSDSIWTHLSLEPIRSSYNFISANRIACWLAPGTIRFTSARV